MNIVLTNELGAPLCGTDGRFKIDGRFGAFRMAVAIDEYRQSFKKNFRYKYDYWTHFGVVGSFRDDPSSLHRIA
jgi:hypothetical protein